MDGGRRPKSQCLAENNRFEKSVNYRNYQTINRFENSKKPMFDILNIFVGSFIAATFFRTFLKMSILAIAAETFETK